MKCLHILPMNKLSGAEKMALLICNNMKEYEPIVVCGGENLKQVFEKNEIKSYLLNFSIKKILKTVVGLKKIIKENNIKIVHAHDNTASLTGYLAKRFFKLDAIVISHIHSCYPWLKKKGLNKRIDSIVRPMYDHNIFCGNIVYDFYKNYTTYVEENKTTILSNAIDFEEIVNFDLKESEEAREKYNIPKDKFILGFVGRLCEIKGIIPFIKEFAKAKEEFLDSRVLLVGSGEQEQEIKELIREFDMEELFILTDFQEEVNRFYPLMDIFFLPSLYEGLPMVILEAMAFRKTVISMDVGSISEVINNDNGKLVKLGEYTEFINELNNIKKDKAKRESKGNNAYRLVSKNYNIKTYINKIEKLYIEIVNNI